MTDEMMSLRALVEKPPTPTFCAYRRLEGVLEREKAAVGAFLTPGRDMLDPGKSTRIHRDVQTRFTLIV